MNKEKLRAIEELKCRYANDDDAMEVIEMSVIDVDYIESREAGGKYTGQFSKQFISGLEAFLHDRY